MTSVEHTSTTEFGRACGSAQPTHAGMDPIGQGHGSTWANVKQALEGHQTVDAEGQA